jgi:hypothetical protein
MTRALAILVLLSALIPALAQIRSLPEDAKRGEIRHVQDMDVEIDGRRQRLAPGAQIRDAVNLLVLPAAIPAGARVKYVLNADGQVHRVWILTPQEAAQPDKR